MRPPADLAEGVEVQVAAKKKGLGRGLDALLPEADELDVYKRQMFTMAVPRAARPASGIW